MNCLNCLNRVLLWCCPTERERPRVQEEPVDLQEKPRDSIDFFVPEDLRQQAAQDPLVNSLGLSANVYGLLQGRNHQSFQVTLNLAGPWDISTKLRRERIAKIVNTCINMLLSKKSKELALKSFGYVIVHLPAFYNNEIYHALFVRLTDNSKNPCKLTAAVHVLGQWCYMTEKMDINIYEDETYLTDLLVGNPRGSLFSNDVNDLVVEGSKTQGGFSKKSVVSIHNTEAPIEDQPGEEIPKFEMTVTRNTKRDSGDFVLDGDFVLQEDVTGEKAKVVELAIRKKEDEMNDIPQQTSGGDWDEKGFD